MHGVRGMLAGALAAVLGLAGCTATAPEPDPTSATTASPTVEETPAALPDGPAGDAARWVLDRLAEPAGTPVPEPELHLSTAFLAQVPADRLAEVFDQLRALAPWTVVAAEGGPSAVQATIEAGAESLDLQLSVDGDGLIAGLLFTPTPPPRDQASSWQDLIEEAAELPGGSLYVAEVVDGRCVPLDGMPAGPSAGQALPIGSMVKLYVLGAVVDAIAAGELAWDDELTVTDDLRSLPSGELQDEPTGTTVTVLEAAQAMISISDNTATDLLVDAVGRTAVEAELAVMGQADPSPNVPLATTRELFQVGWGGGAERRLAWQDADEAGRRALLAALPGGVLEVDYGAIASTAVWPFGVDWFATGADLCAAHVALAERAQTAAGEPIRDILSANPGVPRDGEGGVGVDVWPYVAFKGGSSTGTMGGSWYAEGEGPDARRVVVVVQTATRIPAAALPAATMVAIAQDALRLVADG